MPPRSQFSSPCAVKPPPPWVGTFLQHVGLRLTARAPPFGKNSGHQRHYREAAVELKSFEAPRMSALRLLGIAVRSVVLGSLVVASGYLIVGSAFGFPMPLMIG